MTALVDTGALLAILDRQDPWHARCVNAFESLELPLLTSTAVLTELFHLVGSSRRDVAAAWHFSSGWEFTGAVIVRWLMGGTMIAGAYVLLGRGLHTKHFLPRTYRYAD